MREIQDYFCTFTQKQQLLDLGFDGDSHIITAEYYYNISTPFEGILRSQALDYFRELGYDFNPYKSTNQLMVNGGFNYIITTILDRYQSKLFFETYHEAESALIDKLIQIEKESRNGK